MEHNFMSRSLGNFGFGENFLNIIKLLNNDTNNSISLPYCTPDRFNINKGIKQSLHLRQNLFD